MKKEFGFFSLSILLMSYSFYSHAALRPVASLALGADVLTTHMNQYVTFISPFQNNYVSNNRKVDIVGGLFLGVEQSVYCNLLGQVGVSYYQNANYQAQGVVYQFADPGLGDFNYQYNIQSQRLLLETKLLGTYQEVYHPFINLGVGEAINKAYQYTETPTNSASVPMYPGFGGKTTHSLAYLVGLGVEADVANHTRLGLMYRYVNLGRAGLGRSAIQESTNTLKNNPFYVNELLLQMSYVG
jgi:hypothetical protein